MTVSTKADDRRRQVRETVLPSVDVRPFIGGSFVESKGSNTFSVLDPMTHEVLASVPEASDEDVRAAVTAARSAFDSHVWSEMHPRERARFLFRLADLIERDSETIALLEAADAGKRFVGVSAWDIPNAAEVYRYYAGWADKTPGMVLPSLPGYEISTRREPVGVCAALVPWNFPFPGAAWKAGPALAAGCTVIIKSPERAPLSTQYLGSLFQEAGFPDGVVNIITGRGPTTGRALITDERIDKISFTGSTATGQDILTASATHMPHLTFELGDKTPNIILKDADLDVALPTTASFMFGAGAGQDCVASSRTLVHASILDDVLQRLTEVTNDRRLGDQFAEETQQGPQIDLHHVAQIDGFVQRALEDGASIVTGGEPTGTLGQFYKPTILSGTTNGMRINQQEVFGPVSTVMSFTDIEDAIRTANDRQFGLAAAVWTRDPAKAELFARRVRAGSIWINCYEYLDTVAPWGGRKLSGNGRELGFEGIEGYLVTKSVVRTF